MSAGVLTGIVGAVTRMIRGINVLPIVSSAQLDDVVVVNATNFRILDVGAHLMSLLLNPATVNANNTVTAQLFNVTLGAVVQEWMFETPNDGQPDNWEILFDFIVTDPTHEYQVRLDINGSGDPTNIINLAPPEWRALIWTTSSAIVAGCADTANAGLVQMATEAQTVEPAQTPGDPPTVGSSGCALSVSPRNLLLRRETAYGALYSEAYGLPPIARGLYALDIQSYRAGAGQVAGGAGSVAVGVSCQSSGISSLASGNACTALSDNSSAVGSGNLAAAAASVAHGYFNRIAGANSVGFGRSNFTATVSNIALGIMNNVLTPGNLNDYTGVIINDPQASAVAIGINSTAVGTANRCVGDLSLAVGHKNFANARNAMGIGGYNQVMAVGCLAAGLGNYAGGGAGTGTNATAVGSQNSAQGDYTTAVGRLNTSANYRTSLFGYRNTAAYGSNDCVLLGRSNFASATSVSCIGVGVLNNVLTPGNLSSATGVIVGDPQAQAATIGINSCAVGTANVTPGLHGLAVGHKNSSGGINSIAFGNYNTSTTTGTTAVGTACTAGGGAGGGLSATAVGASCTALGLRSVAMGYVVQTNCLRSAFFGYRVTGVVGGEDCVLVGRSLFNTATSQSAMAFGVLNNVLTPGNLNSTTGVITDPQATAVTIGINSLAVGGGNLTAGLRGVAVGHKCSATGTDCFAAGQYATCANGYAGQTAVGPNTYAGALYASAFGSGASASGVDSFAAASYASAVAVRSNALGSGAISRVVDTTNLAGALIVKRSDESDVSVSIKQLSAAVVLVMTEAVDLETADTFELVLPADCRVYTEEVGLIVTDWDTVTVQPEIAFGIASDNDKYLAAQLTTLLTALDKRERYTTLLADDAEASADNPMFSVLTGATATSMAGRAYWVLHIVEDEA